MSGSELAPFVAAVLRDKVVEELLEEIKSLQEQQLAAQEDANVMKNILRSNWERLSVEVYETYNGLDTDGVVYARTVVWESGPSIHANGCFEAHQRFDNVARCTLENLVEDACIRVDEDIKGVSEFRVDKIVECVHKEDPEKMVAVRLVDDTSHRTLDFYIHSDDSRPAIKWKVERATFDDMELSFLLDIFGEDATVTFEALDGRMPSPLLEVGTVLCDEL